MINKVLELFYIALNTLLLFDITQNREPYEMLQRTISSTHFAIETISSNICISLHLIDIINE